MLRVPSPWLSSSEQRKQPFLLGHKASFLEITLDTGAGLLTLKQTSPKELRFEIIKQICALSQEKS